MAYKKGCPVGCLNPTQHIVPRCYRTPFFLALYARKWVLLRTELGLSVSNVPMILRSVKLPLTSKVLHDIHLPIFALGYCDARICEVFGENIRFVALAIHPGLRECFSCTKPSR